MLVSGEGRNEIRNDIIAPVGGGGGITTPELTSNFNPNKSDAKSKEFQFKTKCK